MTSAQKDQKVVDINELITEITLNACRKQILTFSKQLKAKMLETGITRQVTEDIIKEAFRGYKTMATFHEHCDETLYQILEAYLRPSNRCKDILGRLVVEYAMYRAVKKPLLNPEGSDLDDQTRQVFLRNALPRPLVNYFLVSVRGDVDGIDDFEARPVLFGLENPVMAERRERAQAIAEEHTTRYSYGQRTVDWDGICADERSKKLAYELITDIVRAMTDLGDKRMLKIIQNIQNNDKPVSTKNAMEREFATDDVRLLKAALSRSRELLAKALGFDPNTGPNAEPSAQPEAEPEAPAGSAA